MMQVGAQLTKLHRPKVEKGTLLSAQRQQRSLEMVSDVPPSLVSSGTYFRSASGGSYR